MGNISNYIGGENHGDIVQAGRDANVTQVHGADMLDALIAARRLRAALTDAALDPARRASAAQTIDELESELRKPDPDRDVVAHRLERFTTIVKTAGALLTSGVALATPIGTIASWLGPLGQAINNALR
jgi:hypothetical protein